MQILLLGIAFSENFLDMFFPRELMEGKAQQFMNLRQSRMTVLEYDFKFTQISRYALHMVVDFRAEMNKFLYGLSDLVKTERIMIYSWKI